ncbi:T9SS type A sorting domain-containing protein [Dyadobacter tibetensis]|uniref:T9SS type A sorting domain-containing protein n=1 Tax=Dyadobacter tibetensis TaxID=1211851 RepID=UPI0004BBC8AD|nr:T9SS type A sorting domain-containing protein [Dyadobacter tibetensis]
MRMIYTLLLLIISLVIPAQASPIIGGAIQVKHVSGQTYQIEVQLLSDLSSKEVDTQDLLVCFGDGQTSNFSLTNSQPATDAEGLTLLTYTGTHTYVESGTYQIAVSSPPRSASLLNRSESKHKNVFLWTVINTQFPNSTPLSSPLVREAGLRQAYAVSLQGTDLESDSLSYRLARTAIPSPGTCGVRMQAKQFTYPNDVEKEGVFYIDGSNQLNWTAPTRSGDFYYAIIATEWRNGIKISESYQEAAVRVVEKPGDKIEIPAYQSAEVAMNRPSSNPDEASAVKITIEAYPNPSDDQIKVIVSSQDALPVTIKVLNVNGQELEKVQKSAVHLSESSFSLKKHGSGLYLIKAVSAKGTAVKKVVIK